MKTIFKIIFSLLLFVSINTYGQTVDFTKSEVIAEIRKNGYAPKSSYIDGNEWISYDAEEAYYTYMIYNDVCIGLLIFPKSKIWLADFISSIENDPAYLKISKDTWIITRNKSQNLILETIYDAEKGYTYIRVGK